MIENWEMVAQLKNVVAENKVLLSEDDERLSMAKFADKENWARELAAAFAENERMEKAAKVVVATAIAAAVLCQLLLTVKLSTFSLQKVAIHWFKISN